MEDISKTLVEHGCAIDRLNEKVTKLEVQSEQIQRLSYSVEALAQNIKSMVGQQKEIADRLKDLESEPVKNAKKIKETVITVIITVVLGTILGYILGKVGF